MGTHLPTQVQENKTRFNIYFIENAACNSPSQ